MPRWQTFRPAFNGPRGKDTVPAFGRPFKYEIAEVVRSYLVVLDKIAGRAGMGRAVT
jgi:hypothetical protein